VPGLGSSLINVSGPPLFSPFAGDVLYPTDPRYLGNAADLVEFRIKPTSTAIYYRVTLNSVAAANVAVVGIGIAMRPGSGGPVQWPYGAGISSMGLNAFITAWGTGGALTRLPSGVSTPLPAGDVHMNLHTSQMTIIVPRSLMNPGMATWRYVLGTGLWGGDGWMQVMPGATALPNQPVSGNPLVGAPAVFNLGFRFHEPQGSVAGTTGGLPGYSTEPGTGSWFEDQQAAYLAKRTTGDDYEDVDFAALAAHVNRWLHAPGRVQARIYASSLPIKPGVNHTGVFPEYGGTLQPYLLTLPPDYNPAKRYPLTLSLHASLATYTMFNVFMPNWGAQLGGERGSIVATNLARGINGPEPASGSCVDSAEADFFEMWADIARHFSLNPNRTTVSGYSLGAYAAYQLAEENPDLFANAFTVVGVPPTNGCSPELLGNLSWVPLLAWNQVDDSQVPYQQVIQTQSTLTQLGVRHEQWSFPAGGHLGPALRDDWQPAVTWLGHDTVVRNPPSIDYGYCPALDDPAYRLVHNHAYWISGMRLAHDNGSSSSLALGQVDARSLAFGVGLPTPANYTTTGTAGGSAATVQGTRWTPIPAAPVHNELTLTLENLAALTVDGRGARLTGSKPLTVDITSESPARVRLILALPKDVTTRMTGPHGVAIATDRAGAVLTVPSGTARFVISPR